MRRIRKSAFERVRKMSPAQSDVQGPHGKSRKKLCLVDTRTGKTVRTSNM